MSKDYGFDIVNFKYLKIALIIFFAIGVVVGIAFLADYLLRKKEPYIDDGVKAIAAAIKEKNSSEGAKDCAMCNEDDNKEMDFYLQFPNVEQTQLYKAYA